MLDKWNKQRWMEVAYDIFYKCGDNNSFVATFVATLVGHRCIKHLGVKISFQLNRAMIMKRFSVFSFKCDEYICVTKRIVRHTIYDRNGNGISRLILKNKTPSFSLDVSNIYYLFIIYFIYLFIYQVLIIIFLLFLHQLCSHLMMIQRVLLFSCCTLQVRTIITLEKQSRWRQTYIIIWYSDFESQHVSVSLSQPK